MVSSEERNLALLSHVLCIILGVIAPLIVWLLKKDESAYVERHAKESLNFQISLIIYSFVAGILCFAIIGFVLLPILGIFALVCIVIATIRASKGEWYDYPLTIRLIK
ncbi:DUF4870 domain-containing protein [Paenibacillus doosanensis]|uniref:DUF4870 domain-containing protein n=1 Tax=Paenibacillus konkukensis TaxID=2020716 RepID=A0ABY4RSV5_9BACL|nr:MULTISPECIES: DUF4870 domain-containing protein [Paenibacillus]MCS7463276.1 DUF4870 domain-containing protein [Paenibacillus doosanensis]UQZ85188.1 hypothetical protein SK3146_04471 [Paenibacillus konkukensis]